MKGLIICIKDELTGFDKPQIEVNENSALRGFKFALENNEFLKQNAGQYSLYCLGILNSDTGVIEYDEKINYPKLIVNGSSLVNGVENGKEK